MNKIVRVAKDLYNILEDIDCCECPLETVCELLNNGKSINICTKLSCERGNVENE